MHGKAKSSRYLEKIEDVALYLVLGMGVVPTTPHWNRSFAYFGTESGAPAMAARTSDRRAYTDKSPDPRAPMTE
jgi:hypothetical protein